MEGAIDKYPEKIMTMILKLSMSFLERICAYKLNARIIGVDCQLAISICLILMLFCQFCLPLNQFKGAAL